MNGWIFSLFHFVQEPSHFFQEPSNMLKKFATKESASKVASDAAPPEAATCKPPPTRRPSFLGSKMSAFVKKDKVESSSDSISAQTKRYNEFTKRSGDIILALQKRREAMIQNRKTHQEVCRQITEWTDGTPLAPCMQDTTDVPYATITMSLNKDGIHDEDQFEEAILDYAIEWKQLVTLKFTSGIKQVKDSHRIMDHYERKVDTLRERVLTRVIGNEAPSRLAEKLERNEEKLRQANRTFEKHERNLGLLVDVAIDESWKDLYQLIVRLFTFDAKSSQQQAMVLSDLDNILNGLSLVGREHGLPFEGGGTANLWRNLRSQCQEKSSTNKKKPIKADKSSDSSGSEAATSWAEDSFEQLWSGGEMAAI